MTNNNEDVNLFVLSGWALINNSDNENCFYSSGLEQTNTHKLNETTADYIWTTETQFASNTTAAGRLSQQWQVFIHSTVSSQKQTLN